MRIIYLSLIALASCSAAIESSDETISSNNNDLAVNPDTGETSFPNTTSGAQSTATDSDVDNDGYSSDEDCDDSDALIHPRRLEASGEDGVDDNCNGLVDEPEFTYGYSLQTPSIKVSDNSATIKIRVNDSSTIQYGSSNNLYADITYRKLYDYDNSFKTISKQKVNGIKSSNRYWTYTVSNLSSSTVYQMDVQFYYKSGSSYYAVGPSLSTGSASSIYTTTTNSSSDVSQNRTSMVLQALYQFYESSVGDIGTNGDEDIDGTRFGAEEDEAWCSEFYSFISDGELDGLYGATNVAGIEDYFGDYDQFYAVDEYDDILTNYDSYNLARADYVSLCTHSAMILAFDQNRQELWTVEGNVGNEVNVKRREYDSSDQTLEMAFCGIGHITSDML